MNSFLTLEGYRQLLRPEDRRCEDLSPTARIVAREGTRDGDSSHITIPETRNCFDLFKPTLWRKRRRPTSSDPLAPLPRPRPRRPANADDSRSDSDIVVEAEQIQPKASSPLRSPQKQQLELQQHQHQRQQIHHVLSEPLPSQLPPLQVQVLQRRRLFLSITGDPIVGIEELVQYQEVPSSPEPVVSPLQLAVLPRKCVDEDELPLMPCHSLQYRLVPHLEREKWREPVRDRDKRWASDELPAILSRPTAADKDQARGPYIMTRTVATPMRKWSLWSTQRRPAVPAVAINREEEEVNESLVVSPKARTDTQSPVKPRSSRDPTLLRNQGAMISCTYCILSVYGVGISGRLYGEGLRTQRYLLVDAYDPVTSHRFTLTVSMEDLEWVFHERPEFLIPGRKQAMLQKLISLLYFDYPAEQPPPPTPVHHGTGDEVQQQRGQPCERLPVLCLSPSDKVSEALRRRQEREERLRWEEQQRLLAMAALLGLPRRARHRVLVQHTCISGHVFIVSVFHFPQQVRNLLVVAYHPVSSRTLTLAVGVLEAADVAQVAALPHKLTPEQKVVIARVLVNQLHLRGVRRCGELATEDEQEYRVALALRGERVGALNEWLALPPVATPAIRKTEVITQFMKTRQLELRAALLVQIRAAELELQATTTELQRQLAEANATLAMLHSKDEELKEQIEEINSGKLPGVLGGPSDGAVREAGSLEDKHRHHELRRQCKASRAAIKAESKALTIQVTAWTREQELARQKENTARQKAQQSYDKAIGTLAEQALTETMVLWFDPRQDRHRRPLISEAPGGNRQATILHRARAPTPSVTSLVAGVCCLSKERWRYTMFALGSQDAVIVERFLVEFYEPCTSRRRWIALPRLTWIALTKQFHEAQLLIPALGISSSPAFKRVAELDTAFESTRRSLNKLKTNKKRRLVRNELVKNRDERRLLQRHVPPWHCFLRGLCDRLRVLEEEAPGLCLDRQLYRADLPVVCIANDKDSDDGGDGGDDGEMVECCVRVTLEDSEPSINSSSNDIANELAADLLFAPVAMSIVVFHVKETTGDSAWVLEYPDSVELVKEFAVETLLEQQMHLEAIASTLVLFGDAASGQRVLRFED